LKKWEQSHSCTNVTAPYTFYLKSLYCTVVHKSVATEQQGCVHCPWPSPLIAKVNIYQLLPKLLPVLCQTTFCHVDIMLGNNFLWKNWPMNKHTNFLRKRRTLSLKPSVYYIMCMKKAVDATGARERQRSLGLITWKMIKYYKESRRTETS